MSDTPKIENAPSETTKIESAATQGSAAGRNRRRRRKPRQASSTETPSTNTAPDPSMPTQASRPPRQGRHRPRNSGNPNNSVQPAESHNQSGQNQNGQNHSQPRTGRSQRGNSRKRGRGNNPEVVPPVMAPPSRGRKRPLAEPRIAVGCVVLRGDEILLVRERGRWSLPKGGLEVGELVQDGARRETYEETGLIVEMRELAFVVEFMAETWGHHLQFFYQAREIGGTLAPLDPDRDVQEAKFVPVRQLREYLRFRPRLVALETWLRERRTRHFVFNLDKEPAMLRKRRRIDMERVRRKAQGTQEETETQADLESDFQGEDNFESDLNYELA